MTTTQRGEAAMNSAPAGFLIERDLPAGFAAFFAPLHARFTPWQQQLLGKRREALARSLQGRPPGYLPPSPATTQDWRIDLPAWCADQRNQMTGPADDAELVVKMLNSGAPGVMLDLEDSMSNEWSHTMLGVRNVLAALRGELTYEDRKRGGTVAIKESSTAVSTRVRGLHLGQAGVLAEPVSASIFDLALLVFQVDFAKLKHPLTIYIPKSESAEEALWWDAALKAVATARGQDPKAIKCMALVEAHPMAFEFEEFAYNLRDHILALNLGRWDYMASLIHFMLEDAGWVLPDRNSIPHDVPFFQNLRLLIPSVCHRHGMLAIGGMTALYPSRDDAELNERALRVLEVDKRNEATCLMDGAWTGHPDQNAIAVAQFPQPNQLASYQPGYDQHPDLRPSIAGVGKLTEDGTRAAVRTVLRYRDGYLSGRGASLLDGYMEDLATDRIYRLMIDQRIRHGHTSRERVEQLFAEELAKLSDGAPSVGAREQLEEARDISLGMLASGTFDPI
jgi:malate synthase